MTDWQNGPHILTQQLVDIQVLDESWRAAFEATPRHLFVPRFYRQDMSVVEGSDPRDYDEWLRTVYSDQSLITQYSPVRGTDVMWPTSSSTKPSLMARMLRLLDVNDGDRVLEVGTGTGYNTALLCHRLGDHNVASIDVNPDLVATARIHLAELGWYPKLVSGDGAQGIPELAPFDRIIATCAVPTVPPSWISQLHQRGIIVSDLRGELASNLIVLHKADEDTVQGRFLPIPGHFMWLRPHADNPLRDQNVVAATINRDGAIERSTRLDPVLLDHPDLRFMLQWHRPSIQEIWRTQRVNTELLCIRSRDGGWVEVDTTARGGRYVVTEVGSAHIWEYVETAADNWLRLGRPPADRFGLTATSQRYSLWLDTPDAPVLSQRE